MLQTDLINRQSSDSKVEVYYISGSLVHSDLIALSQKHSFQVAADPSGLRFVSGSWDKSIKLWEVVNLHAAHRVVTCKKCLLGNLHTLCGVAASGFCTWLQQSSNHQLQKEEGYLPRGAHSFNTLLSSVTL